MTQNQQNVQCEVMTDSGQTVDDSSGLSNAESRDGKVDVPTDIGGM